MRLLRVLLYHQLSGGVQVKHLPPQQPTDNPSPRLCSSCVASTSSGRNAGIRSKTFGSTCHGADQGQRLTVKAVYKHTFGLCAVRLEFGREGDGRDTVRRVEDVYRLAVATRDEDAAVQLVPRRAHGPVPRPEVLYLYALWQHTGLIRVLPVCVRREVDHVRSIKLERAQSRSESDVVKRVSAA